MSYMTCPRCGLSVHIRAHYLTVDRCPRCLARRGVIVPMESSERPVFTAADAVERPLASDRLRPASSA